MDSLEKTSHQPLTSSSHLSNHSEHKDGHVRRPGHLTLRPPAGGWRTTEAFGGYLWEANRPRGIEKRLRHWFPDHFPLEARPNCLLTEHLGESVSSSGKDILLFCWPHWWPRGLSAAVLSGFPLVSLMCACGPLNDRWFTFYRYNLSSVGKWFYK